MQNIKDLFCQLCLDYYVRPVTTVCGHSFCQYCLQQYFLHFDQCIVCSHSIRKQKMYRSSALSNFVQHYIQNEHKQYKKQYEQKKQKHQTYKQNKQLSEYAVGEIIDIRDINYIWRLGIIKRIISRVGQICKIIKIQYVDCSEKNEEELRINSDRLAKEGFYTNRDDIPTYEPQSKQNKLCNNCKNNIKMNKSLDS